MDEVRSAGPASLLCSSRHPPTGGGDASSWGLKLPMLTARPGNVGVQIDSFRTMKLFHRPRCGKFTAQFQGISYENHSMENHSRIVERTQLRARIVSERLQKLKEHEAKMIADEQRRRERRKEREAAEQRHQWLMRQAAKKEEQRQKEEQAARSIQRSSLKTFVRKKRTEKSRQEREKERRLRAAQTIQRQVRRRRDSGRHVLEPLKGENQRENAPDNATQEADASAKIETQEDAESPEFESRQESLPEESPRAETPSTDEMSHELSLELLFSIPSPKSASTCDLHAAVSAGSQKREPIRPRRPVTIKRVGGGFRQSTFQSPRLRTSKPPDLAAAISSLRPQPPQHHQARIPRGRVAADVNAQRRARDAEATRLEEAAIEKHTPDSHYHARTEPCAVPYVAFSADDDAGADDEEDTLLELVQQLDS